MGLPLPASDPYLHLNLYRPARITESLSQLLSHRLTSRLGQRGQRLTGGTSAALERAVISVEGRQHEYVLLGVSRDVQKKGVDEELLQPRRVTKRKSPVGGLRQVWLMPGQNDVDPAVVGPFRGSQDRDSSAPA